MADVSHELGSLRFVVDSPLSSKVAMFNNQAQQHKKGQLLNPFSESNGRVSPKPTFSKDEYGKPLAGSLTEARGQRANMHVMREMLELCQIIDSEGYKVNDEPTMRVIPFGELFNIYNYISDKVVGILLRARKYKLVDFEGEMLFQRRDDDVPVFLLKPIQEIRRELEAKIEDIKRAASPAPQATTLLLDKTSKASSRASTPATSKAPSPATSKAGSPAPPDLAALKKVTENKAATAASSTKTVVNEDKIQPAENKNEITEKAAVAEKAAEVTEKAAELTGKSVENISQPAETLVEPAPGLAEAVLPQSQAEAEPKKDVNNNKPDELPTIVIEASAEYVSESTTAEKPETSESVVENKTD